MPGGFGIRPVKINTQKVRNQKYVKILNIKKKNYLNNSTIYYNELQNRQINC